MIDTLQYPRRIDDNGYIRINFEGEWILEHRFVVEQYLFRNLKTEEKIHHEDFNKMNNDINNLVIFPTNKAHAHWHRQVKQFGITRVRLIEIEHLRQLMINEHNSKQAYKVN